MEKLECKYWNCYWFPKEFDMAQVTNMIPLCRTDNDTEIKINSQALFIFVLCV